MEKTERIEKTETPERAETTIPVVIADDDAGMRAVMRKMIERVEGVKLVGEAQDGRELLAQVEQKRPKLVFLDVEMPQMSGVEAARIIQDTDPSVILVFATAHDRYMADAFEVYAFAIWSSPSSSNVCSRRWSVRVTCCCAAHRTSRCPTLRKRPCRAPERRPGG